MRLEEHPIACDEPARRETFVRQGVALTPGLPPIRYEVCGAAEGPAVLVLGGISASRHVTRNEVDGRPGWWEDAVGPGRAVDTDRFCVIGIDHSSSIRGTIEQARPRTAITTFDQARAIAATLDAIGVPSLRAIVGASYGGMIALGFAERYADRVDRIVIIAAAHESDPMTTTLRAIQRRIVRLAEKAGDPREGVALARALAMTTYRTRAEFAERFSNQPAHNGEETIFPAEEYVISRGDDYADRTRATDFRALTLSLDLHAVTPEDIAVPATIIGVIEDQLVPISAIRELARRLGGPSNLIELSSTHGHDAFLTDTARLAPLIRDALADPSVSAS